MSSVLVLAQRERVHLMTDAASYDRATGVLKGVTVFKAIAIPTLSMAIAVTGPVENTALFAAYIAQNYPTFDEAVRQADEDLPSAFEAFSREWRRGDAISSLYMIGWLQEQNRPAAFSINLWTDGCSTIEAIVEESAGAPAIRTIEEQTYIPARRFQPLI